MKKMIQIKIETQLKISFIVLLLLELGLSNISYFQIAKVNTLTITLYEHPYTVRKAIAELKANILLMQSDVKDIYDLQSEKELERYTRQNNSYYKNSLTEISVIYDK